MKISVSINRLSTAIDTDLPFPETSILCK